MSKTVQNKKQKQKICDYSDTDYKEDFWGRDQREYEDSVERLAINKLFPEKVGRFLELGAGFGRLIDDYYARCGQVQLIDYAENLVGQAREKVKKMGLTNVKVDRGNVYDLSLLEGKFTGCMMVRVLHHIEDVPALLAQLNKKLENNGFFIMEYANKRNILEIARMLLRKNQLAPFGYEPQKRGKGLYFNYHPQYIKDKLEEYGFIIEEELMVSMFRSRMLKKMLGARLLSKVENILQRPLGWMKLSPSVFIRARKVREI